MTRNEVSLSELVEYRKKLVQEIGNKLTEQDYKFLISFVKNKPDWSLFRNSKIKDYPSVKWKLFNQEKMNKDKSDKYIQDIELLFK